MFRPASRAVLRTPAVAVRGPASAGRRLISTTPTETKSRSWKNTFVRLGLAAGAVYYYNTSNVFTETPSLFFRSQPQPTSEDDSSSLPTLNSVKPKIREEKAATPSPSPAPASDSAPAPQSDDAQSDDVALKSAGELEQEAGQEEAFNPETGEINWDCPCLGGMAHGPCGEEFKAAFSCFVYSEEEPKGIDCIDKFQAMQNCFRQYPDVYGPELEDDEEAAASGSAEGAEQPVSAQQMDAASTPDEKHAHAKEVHDQVKSEANELAESEELIPKALLESEQQTEK
ncbi:hypothetical protein P175DRAFT_0526362 [Aspergillus ochraceoroseus IBT 24754]|uniref:Mitochondrial intermembrane space import and assembly protein 40 n=3 Tax=Aspergillus subgen. Nidulantes TaxID=2720870 RepID=A0A2T5LNI0_9EURO|nr:uncharacterized protein P175DRAFT_0526362 [Aspergillus ochraceoroseus IBT 24754]KKK17995.1 hypothetical protein AOCH_004287 [Aspergillus ochraceoroseus]PTU17839.1 hypothetical protein P175DRAFT_0526362 [Aspergillus ochraceoroseus IBT 24754]